MDRFGDRRKAGMGFTEDLRWAAAKLLKMGKSAVDSAVYESLSGGMQVYTTVKQSLQDDLSSRHQYADKNTRFFVVEQIKEKQEKIQKDMNSIKQQKISILRTKEQEIQEQFSGEPLKCSTPEVISCRKKISIRSRL